MTRYHLTASGDPAVCKARVRACPLGDQEDHFDALVEDQARVWAEAVLEAQYGLFEDDLLEVLDSYQSGSYRNINAHLRGELRVGPGKMYSPFIAKTIARMDAMFTHHEEVSPPTVWRRVRSGPGSGYLESSLEVGSVVVEPGYLSTSEDPDFNARYLDKGPDRDVNTLMSIEVPETAACLRPQTHTLRYADENEVLFPRGTRFEVLEDRREGSVRLIRLSMLDSRDPREASSSMSSPS